MKRKHIYTLFLALILPLGGLSIASAQYYSGYSYGTVPVSQFSGYGYYGSPYSSQSYPYYGSSNTYYNSSYTYVSGCGLYSYNGYTGVSTYVRDVCQSNTYQYNYQYPYTNYQYQTYPYTYNNNYSHGYHNCGTSNLNHGYSYMYNQATGTWYPVQNGQNCYGNTYSNYNYYNQSNCYYQNGSMVCY